MTNPNTEADWQSEAMHQNRLLHDALTRAQTAEANLADAVTALRMAIYVCQRAINGYAAKMQSSTNRAEGRNWQTMLFAALDIKHAILENIPANVAALDEIKGETK
jgi:Na+/phosphate symporter